MAATQTVPQHSQHCNFSPITPRSGVITLFGYGVRVCVERGHLVLEDGIGPLRRRGRFARIRHGIKRVVTIGSDGLVSLAALRWLADQNAAFVMLEGNGEVLATTGPVRPSDARLRRSQGVAHESGVALKIAKGLITQKLIAQNEVIEKYFNNSPVSQTIRDARKQIGSAKSSDELRRWEAQAALAYWSAWRAMPIVFCKVDATKVPDHWKSFGGRVSPLTNSPRLAVNPPNAILNYLYAILEAEARLTLAELGLDPGLGVMHNDSRTRDSLASDLMEPIRPKVDAMLLDLLSLGELRREWFFEQADGNCRLLSPFAGKLSETANNWRTTLAPLAEWIARSLWDAKFRGIREQIPATRLTQRHRSEARTALSRNGSEVKMLRPTLCKGCGQVARSERNYCPSCVDKRGSG